MARELRPEDVPEGWRYDLLDKLTQRCSGHTPSKSHSAYWNGSIKWISLADSFRLDKGYVYETDKQISNDGLKNSSAELHPAGTVVLVRDAGIGKSGVMAESMAVSQHFIAWKCDNQDNMLNWFLYNWLQLHKKEFERQAVGSTIKTIGLPFFKKLRIAAPPFPEQRKIAKILQTWDHAIATTEKLIDASKQQKKALMQQLLTGKKRFSGFEGVWKEGRLEKHIDLLSGFAFKSSEFEKNSQYKLLRGINISRGYLRWSDENTFTWTNAKDFTKYQLEVNDIVISMDGSLVGRNYVLVTSKNIEKMLLVQRVARLRCKKTLSHEYLVQHISSAKFTSHVDAVKTVTAIPHISAKDIKDFQIPIPDKAEQHKISAVLANADREIEALGKKLTQLKQEKKALMQQLLTGKRRVKVDE